MATESQLVSEVQSVARDVSTSSGSSVPVALLRLGGILESAEAISTRTLLKVKEQIWLNDLIHTLVEALHDDGSIVRERLSIATQLSGILSSTCVGFFPKAKITEQPSGEDVSTDIDHAEEYYELLLPAAVDALLILLNNLLQSEPLDGASESPGIVEPFKSIIDSLVWLCASHKQCLYRVLQSQYLLHILITENAQCSHHILTALRKLIKSDRDSLSSVSLEMMQNIFDELVYKLSGNEKKAALLSLKLLASAVLCSQRLMELIVTRYNDLLLHVQKWNWQKLGADVRAFVAELETKLSGEVGSENSAAVMIQAAWRGYSTRRKMQKVQKGIQRFQLLYRKRKAQKLKSKEISNQLKSQDRLKEASSKAGLLSFHEKQMSLVEQLPASDLKNFVNKQQSDAAAKLQSWWRGKLAQQELCKRRENALLTKSALTIQRAIRRYLHRKSKKPHSSDVLVFPRIEGVEREQLQLEIARFRECHPVTYMTESERRHLHDEVQRELEQLYVNLTTTKQQKQTSALVSRVNDSCELLLKAPQLKDCTPATVNSFSSSSSNVVRMAQAAHREELKAMDTPWWKQSALDSDEIIL